jgi:delta8-fatty-acid desaturase
MTMTVVNACMLAFFWHQMAFVAHDTGHCGITHNVKIDTLIGVSLANFFGGISIGWCNFYVSH